MESSHLVIFSTSGKFSTKFNVLCCMSLSETLFWTGAKGRIPITVRYFLDLFKSPSEKKTRVDDNMSIRAQRSPKVKEVGEQSEAIRTNGDRGSVCF